MEDISVCFETSSTFDPVVFKLWVEGKTPQAALNIIINNRKLAIAEKIQQLNSIDSKNSEGRLESSDDYYSSIIDNELIFPPESIHHKLNQATLLHYDIVDQYRSYNILEHFLSHPVMLQGQSLCYISHKNLPVVIELYWDLNDKLVYEILHRRLTKSRRDLADIAELCNFNMRRTTLQFENIKRIYDAFEESSNYELTNIYKFISTQYLLSDRLTRKYSCIIFLLITKFHLSYKKRLSTASCHQLENCAALIVAFLSADSPTFFSQLFEVMQGKYLPSIPSNYSLGDFVNTRTPSAQGSRQTSLERESSGQSPDSISSGTKDGNANIYNNYLTVLENDNECWCLVWKIFSVVDDTDIDKTLLSSLRDIRSLLTGEGLDLACNQIKSKIGPKLVRLIDGNSNSSNKIRSILKALIQIGANLSQTREYRDLFEDILCKVAEPLLEAGLSFSEINHFMICCIEISNDMTTSIMRHRRDSFASDTSQANMKTGISKSELIKLDWVRFLAFIRLCLQELLKS